MPRPPTDHVYRESPWQWPLHAFLLFIGGFFLLMAFGWTGLDRAIAIAHSVVSAGASALNLLSRRRVAFGPEGIAVSGVRLTWSEIERFTFREVPPVRAGLLLRLTAEARARLGLRSAGRHTNPRGEAFDLYLRANGDTLVEWFELVALHALSEAGERLQRGVELAAEAVSRARVELITEDPFTIAVHVGSLAELEASAPLIARALPDAARWDPAFDGRLMILVGPLRLADERGAEEALARVREAVAASAAGTLVVEAMFAERAHGSR